jgi:hypothetical protein
MQVTADLRQYLWVMLSMNLSTGLQFIYGSYDVSVTILEYNGGEESKCDAVKECEVYLQVRVEALSSSNG